MGFFVKIIVHHVHFLKALFTVKHFFQLKDT